ncbi:outer membrane transport protein [Duganella sp. BJB488]|uniref:OmpP1/FadL family transporter n=1 Tax=unclassified Duganella TaxID=2636909 RepID=UPI000E34C28C|nr:MULTISPECIES: outer membrane protein transport protein [unclassified Duganella]RFP08405.1 outer membrane transport protein [Duganella sp. BJB489]RFP10576.1 outer membrane transport protein [Duganella sp. BJB488]RFP27437.1 outer membrane transport protein [Duganella sp. BJB480]
MNPFPPAFAQRRLLAAAVASACTALCPLPAHAALTENLTTSVVAMSLGNAVTADPPGVASIHFNPAGLARLTGDGESIHNFVASIRTAASFTPGPNFDIGGWKDDPISNTRTGPVRQVMYVPGYGMPGWRLPAVAVPGIGMYWNKAGSPWTFATDSYMAQAMSLDRTTDPNDPGQYQGRQEQIQRLVYLAPSVGYKYSDTLSFGVAVPIAHAAFVVDTNMRFPNELLGVFGQLQKGWCPEDGGNIIDVLGFGVCGGGKDGMVSPFKKAANMRLELTAPFDPTLNLGVLWEPRPWLALGAVYQGGSKTHYTGNYRFDTEPMLRNFVRGMNASLLGPIAGAVLGFPTSIPATQKGNMSAIIPFPSHLQVGIKLKPIRYAQLNVDASYARWSEWDALRFQFDQSIKLLEVARLYGIPDSGKLVIPRGYKSVVNMAYGLQLFPMERLALRFGYEPRKTSIPNNKLDLLAPLPNTKLLSTGLSFKFSKNTEVSVTASYMTGKYDVPANTDCNLNCSNFLNIIYNPYAGQNVKGDIHVRYFGFEINKRF